jgi:tetratricopeptide (TPR) repeat protein
MFKKILLVSLTSFGLAFSTSKICFADASADLRRAQQYEKTGHFAKAESVYKAIVTSYPGTDQAYKAQERLVMAYILAGRSGPAATELSKFKQDFSNRSDLVDSLYWIARRYSKSERFDEASALFAEITARYPDSVYAKKVALNAPATKILKLINRGSYSEAEAETNHLISQFKGNDGLPEPLYDIARRFKEKGQYAKAKVLYQYILDNHAGCSYADLCTLDVHKMTMCGAIEAGDFQTVDDQFDYLINTYGNSDLDVASVLHFMAVRCEWVKQYEKAKQLHQRIIDTFPDSQAASECRVDLDKCDILALIKAGNYSSALSGVDNLMAKFSGNPYLPTVISKGIALQCYNEALVLEQQGNIGEANKNYQLAASIWEEALMVSPSARVGSEACITIAACYRKLGDLQKSTQYYQKVIDDYPLYKLRWHALAMLGQNYEKMKGNGLVSKSEADSKTAAAYQQLIDSYPDCKSANVANKWLKRHNAQ